MRFSAREKEVCALRRSWRAVKETGVSQLVTVSGRRLVGKTTLVLRAFENIDAPLLFFTVPERTEKTIAKVWFTELQRVFRPKFLPESKDLPSVLSFAMTLSRERPCVFVMDECREIERVSPGFWRRFADVWDAKRTSSRMLLVMTGSDLSSEDAIFEDEAGPLRRRAACRLYGKPFSPSTIRRILDEKVPGHTPMDLLTVYAMTGGVAGCLEHLAAHDALTAKTAVRFLFSQEGRWLREECGDFLARAFPRKTAVYKEILHAVAEGRTKWTEIQDRIGERVSSYLTRLEAFGLVRRTWPIFDETESRKTRYRIADPSLRFWLTFVDPIRPTDLAACHRWGELVRLCEVGLPSFLRTSLAEWHHAVFLESGCWPRVGTWWDAKGGNVVDLIAVNEEQRSVLFGEAVLNAEEYDEGALRRKAAAFLEAHQKFADFRNEYVGLFPESL